MKGNPEERAVVLGEYVVETGSTVRSTAQQFGISKSTVHKDLTQRLKKQNRTLYDSVHASTQGEQGRASPARWSCYTAKISSRYIIFLKRQDG